MRRTLPILIFLIGWLPALTASATHMIQYFVYHERYYLQGPWPDAAFLDQEEPAYLDAVYHEDLFGTVPVEFAKKLIQRLSDDKPGVYEFESAIEVRGDTVELRTMQAFLKLNTLRNELTATFINNGFSVVILYAGISEYTWTEHDIDLPFLGLRFPDTFAYPRTAGASDSTAAGTADEEGSVFSEEGTTELSPDVSRILYALVAVNCILIVLLVIAFARTNRQKRHRKQNAE